MLTIKNVLLILKGIAGWYILYIFHKTCTIFLPKLLYLKSASFFLNRSIILVTVFSSASHDARYKHSNNTCFSMTLISIAKYRQVSIKICSDLVDVKVLKFSQYTDWAL